MATPVIMPRQGQSVESCIIAKWHKKKGDKVEVGDILFSYETDKASFDEEAKAAGTFHGAFFEEGDDVPCLTNVCVIGSEGEDIQAFNPNSAGTVEKEIQVPEVQVPEVKVPQEEAKIHIQGRTPECIPAIQSDNELKISPRAKNLAQKIGIDFRYATPTGPYGRIIEQDISALKDKGYTFTQAARDEHMKGEARPQMTGTGLGGRITTADLNANTDMPDAASTESTAAGTNAPMYDEVKISNIRKVIAKAMQNSLATTAQLTLNTSFDATEIMEFRKKLKEGKDRLGLENITINDIILFAVSRTLLNHKDLNANFTDDKMLYFRNVNLGMAVDTERGLMVPTIMNANLKSLNEISKEAKKLARDCQAGSISPDLLKNGSFTITNLGTLGIESFTPVINPPQTGILGVNTIVQRAREVGGEYVFYPAMGLSLTFDHKALDGAPAAKFLKELVTNLENFSALLVK